jgi:hypothetical protein
MLANPPHPLAPRKEILVKRFFKNPKFSQFLVKEIIIPKLKI